MLTLEIIAVLGLIATLWQMSAATPAAAGGTASLSLSVNVAQDGDPKP